VAFMPSAKNVMWDRALVDIFKTTTQNWECDVFVIL